MAEKANYHHQLLKMLLQMVHLGDGGGFPGGTGLEKLLLKIQGPGSGSSAATCRQWDRGNLI